MAKAATARKPAAKAGKQTSASDRAFRGLFLPLVLSLLNFVGLVISAASLGLGNWDTWQFAALFGSMEAGAGIAAVVLPNIWHLPVVELDTSRRTRAHLSLPTVLLPHWGSLARSIAGVVLMGLAAYNDGIDASSAALIPPFILFVAWLNLTLSLLVARIGVQWAAIDVFQLMVRWRGEIREAKPLSISTSALQFLIGIITLPLAEAFSPSQLFDKGPGPNLDTVLVIGLLSAVTALAAVVVWWGRFSWQAPPEQQREVEENA